MCSPTSMSPHASSTSTRRDPTAGVAAATAPAVTKVTQRARFARTALALSIRCQLDGMSEMAALSATAGTAAPAPAAAPATASGGCEPRKSADRARISTSPGQMKHAPPNSAPTVPRSLHAQKIAS